MRCFLRVEQHRPPAHPHHGESIRGAPGWSRTLVPRHSTIDMCTLFAYLATHPNLPVSSTHAPMPFMSVSQGKGVIQRHAATARACTPRCLTTLDRTTRSKYIHHHCATHETLLKTRTMVHCLYVRKLHFVPSTRFQSRSAHTTHAFSASVPVTKDLPAHLTVARAPLIG